MLYMLKKFEFINKQIFGEIFYLWYGGVKLNNLFRKQKGELINSELICGSLGYSKYQTCEHINVSLKYNKKSNRPVIHIQTKVNYFIHVHIKVISFEISYIRTISLN